MKSAFLGLVTLGLLSCESQDALPILGPREAVAPGDTLYHTIPAFSFTDQLGREVNNQTFWDQVYVADFFFTTCPSICPIMRANLLDVQAAYQDDPQVALLSHTLDPEHDSVAVLKSYGERLGVNPEKWRLVTGERKTTYALAQEHYMISALEDENEPGGIVHSGALILIDKSGHIRGYYDGTLKEDVAELIEDIEILLQEYR